MRVAVVGAGIAGIACARVLAAGGHEVVVLDRGRVPGGRMASRTLDDRVVDLGASYLVARDPAFTAVVADWQQRGLARPWTTQFAVWDGGLQPPKPGPTRWAAPRGLRSLVADLATGLDVRQGVDVTSAGQGRADDQAYDEVVLAMPDPQALRLLDDSCPQERALLEGRAWHPVLALAARAPRRSWDWDGLFVHGSKVLEWVADDGSRRGDGAPVLVAHSTPSFAAQHLQDPAGAAPELVAALAPLLGRAEVRPDTSPHVRPDTSPQVRPAAPAPAAAPAPVQLTVQRVQRWSFAKPADAREQPFHRGRVSLCGDGWGASKVEAAWLSGTALGQDLCS